MSRSKHYVVKADMLSSSRVQMLDVDIGIGNGRFHLSIFTKPTALGVPLHWSSHHPWFVHISWPYGRLKHFERVSSSREAFIRTSVEFLFNLHRQYGQFPSMASLIRFLERRSTGKYQNPDKQVGSWLVLPFSDSSGYGKVISDFRRVTNLPADIAPKLSWSLSGKKLSQKLQAVASTSVAG